MITNFNLVSNFNTSRFVHIYPPMAMNLNSISGCTAKKKAKFYQRLFSSLISEWILALGDEANDDAITSKDKAVRWKFEQLDANNNSVICNFISLNEVYLYIMTSSGLRTHGLELEVLGNENRPEVEKNWV